MESDKVIDSFYFSLMKFYNLQNIPKKIHWFNAWHLLHENRIEVIINHKVISQNCGVNQSGWKVASLFVTVFYFIFIVEPDFYDCVAFKILERIRNVELKIKNSILIFSFLIVLKHLFRQEWILYRIVFIKYCCNNNLLCLKT